MGYYVGGWNTIPPKKNGSFVKEKKEEKDEQD